MYNIQYCINIAPFGKRWDKRDRRRMRGRPNRPRRRQRKHRNETEDDAGEGGTDEADAAAEEMEVDEVSVKGGVKAFASHPVVQMFAKRRACMRKTSQITKRPTLLHMVRYSLGLVFAPSYFRSSNCLFVLDIS